MTQAEPALLPPTPPTSPTSTTAPHPADVEESLRDQLLGLSDGNVVALTPDGPVFGRPRRRLATRPTAFVRQLSGATRVKATLLSAAWVACLVWFWSWWLQPEHRVGWVGLIVNSALLAYLALLPVHFIVAVIRLRRFDPKTEVPELRVAFAVTRAPSEGWAIARATLRAMLDQEYPHPYDVWLCDEDPTPRIRRWCRRNGVRISCRKGVAEYHRDTWPRRTRCKEGNLAYFYDHWGYAEYDVVAQLDCDHVPRPGYLAEVVRPFADPAIGYVAAPSVCDANADASWSARGRLHREAIFHGPVQLGHSAGLAPVCIGSHYAVRTAALKDIGGLGPELAEDFTTTFLLNSAGWHGAFAIDAEAHGEGPITFSAMVTQEFQWSRSLAASLMGLLPKHVRRLPALLRLRFTIVLVYYPLLALTTTAGLTLPPVAAVTGLAWINVNYFAFLGHFWAMSICLILLALLLRRRGLLRPPRAPVVSWEGWLFALARWPWVAWGVGAAVLQRLRPRTVTFKVTPKSRDGLEPLALRLVAPYLLITVALSSAAVVGELTGPAVGYVFLCIVAASSYAVVTLAVSWLHVCETARANGVRRHRALRTARLPLLAGTLALAPLALAYALYPVYFTNVLRW
ncbi:glycosyltransferase family 2 protein [Streptomyces sp. WMMC1477]|uniref:glycosyltransferase family 2 protein n=1 Tax=Streptomyces sp. WMMC1477 TaxID=3015155 RepID=UPI0022B5EEE7|nr:glycosyltransferase family 2 protein [Streptomyces sp. WMMC1477]MCZ7432936.1 glycosyltransferase [Streptomyces sp. WMMC1477]